MNTSIIILVCALIAIATAQKCVEDNVHAYVPSYKAFTNYIGDEGHYMYFTWNQDLLNLTDYPCSRSDGVRFEVTSYADKTLSNPNTRLTSTFGISYGPNHQQNLANPTLCRTTVTRYQLYFMEVEATQWSNTTYNTTFVTDPVVPPHFTSSVSNNEAAQEYTITINFENAANTKCGCTGLLNNAFYRVEWEQRGNYTTQATTQSTTLAGIPDDNGDLIVTTNTVCQYFVNGGQPLEVISPIAHRTRLHVNPFKGTVTESDDSSSASFAVASLFLSAVLAFFAL